MSSVSSPGLNVLDPATAAAGVAHLCEADEVMGALIGRVGPFRLIVEPDPFRMLVRSVISQQISTKAAAAIRQRLEARAGRLSAARIMAMGEAELRACGLSSQKSAYLLDLAGHVTSRRLQPGRLRACSDEEVIRRLTAVRGIGVWTAQMLLIFGLGRLDVLPEDDYGVRAAIRNLYGLDDLPTRAQIRHIAGPWRPYATIASWYCWRSLDLPCEPRPPAKAAK